MSDHFKQPMPKLGWSVSAFGKCAGLRVLEISSQEREMMERRKKELVWVWKRVRVFTLRILEINSSTQNHITFVTARRPKSPCTLFGKPLACLFQAVWK